VIGFLEFLAWIVPVCAFLAILIVTLLKPSSLRIYHRRPEQVIDDDPFGLEEGEIGNETQEEP
jgi:hypothetical protein